MDSVGNISGSEVGATVRVGGSAPSGLQEQSRGSGGRSLSEADDVLLMQQQTFCIHSHAYAEMQHKKGSCMANRHIFGGVQ